VPLVAVLSTDDYAITRLLCNQRTTIKEV